MDAVNPDHYKRLPAEAIEIIEAMIAGAPDNKAAYLHGQAAKYDLRLWGKGKSLEDYLTDWQKHIWYALRLESHLMELIEKQKADEKQKASDLQSLKDHPFGKLKQPKWTPKVGDWVRINKPSSDKRDSVLWSIFMDGHDKEVVQVKKIEDGAILHGEWFFPFDWLEPAKPPKEQPQPPDGWRWLEVGEVFRKGDTTNTIEPISEHWVGTQCVVKHVALRRNRFEVGEKVVDYRTGVIFTVHHFNKTHQIVFVDGISDGIKSKHLAPYIEETK